MPQLNFTHDPARRSWVASANSGGDFPIQNLPFGVFRKRGEEARGCVAIGDMVIDLRAMLATGLLQGEAARAAEAASGPVLNPLLALGNGPASALRARLSEILVEGGADEAHTRPCLFPIAEVELLLPVAVRQFTDMSVSSFHLGRSRGNDENGDPLVRPTFKWQPVGYNGRASSVVVSGTPLRRPLGQWLSDPKDEEAQPVFGPEPRQDYEMELAAWIGGPANALGEPIPIGEAPERLFGFSIMNDWSSRRIQVRESALGPFLSKSMGTTVSPWIVTAEALAPFRIPTFIRPKTAPAPLPHLSCPVDQAGGGIDLDMTALVRSAAMRAERLEPTVICQTNAKYLYWSWAQIIAHHSSAGCDMATGDLIGSGTCSGPAIEQAACLSEKTGGGTRPWSLATGETRTYIEDGDEVICVSRANREGFVPIGFGECSGELLPAPAIG